MVTLSENAEDNLPRAVNLSWRVRLALLTIFLLAVGTVYITNQFLTARFTQTTLQRAQLRLALYSGNLVSELQKNSIVPSLLGSDAELIGALTSKKYVLTHARKQKLFFLVVDHDNHNSYRFLFYADQLIDIDRIYSHILQLRNDSLRLLRGLNYGPFLGN